MNSDITELFTHSTEDLTLDWADIAVRQHCHYLSKKCFKIRKSQPEISIGTCTVGYGVKNRQNVIICPARFLERNQIFMDCIHLLTLHQPGNELHKIAEVSIPGGSVDYFLVSARQGKVVDFVGIELQALDTTGTTWTARQNFLKLAGVGNLEDVKAGKGYGMNWKMTAKTILVQLNHKAETFEHINKHFVLSLQDGLFEYMQREFQFAHVEDAKLGDSIHFHIYGLNNVNNRYRLELRNRKSTDVQGIARSLGLQANARIELEIITSTLQSKLSDKTLMTI